MDNVIGRKDALCPTGRGLGMISKDSQRFCGTCLTVVFKFKGACRTMQQVCRDGHRI